MRGDGKEAEEGVEEMSAVVLKRQVTNCAQCQAEAQSPGKAWRA